MSKELIEKILGDEYEVTSLVPFKIKSTIDEWSGQEIPAAMILAKSLLSLSKDSELEDVRRFHNKFDLMDSGRTPTMVTKRKLMERFECMQEELNEFKAAVEAQDFEEQADALVDLVTFAKGTAVMMGLPWENLWNDVQRANSSKVRGVGKRGHAVDMVKPEGWKKPDGAKILADAGFKVEDFQTNGVVDELKCYDEAYFRPNTNSAVESSPKEDSASQAVDGAKWSHSVADLEVEIGSDVAETITASLIDQVNQSRTDRGGFVC